MNRKSCKMAIAWVIFVFSLMCFMPVTASSRGNTVETAQASLDMTGAIEIKDPFGACHADSYDIMEELGVKMNRKDISWSSIEQGDDNWQWNAWDNRISELKSRNMTVLPILDYGNLAVQTGTDHGNRIHTEHDIKEWMEYVNECVERYYVNDSNYVDNWEIWNEANLGDFNASEGFWTGTDEEFFELQRRTAQNLSVQYPGLNILSNGISGHDPTYLSAMFASGAMEHVDTLAFHPYSGSSYDTLPVKIDAVKQVCKEHGFNGSLWITEVGMSTQFNPNEPGFKTEYKRVLELQATLVPKVYAHALAEGIETIVWYCLGDGHNFTWGEHNFGLIFHESNVHKPEPYDGDVLKPSGYAYKALAHNLNWSTYIPRGVKLARSLPSTSKLERFYFTTSSGDILLILWNENNDANQVEFKVEADGITVFGPPSYKEGIAKNYHATTMDGMISIQATIDLSPTIFLIDVPEGVAPSPVLIQSTFTVIDATFLFILPFLGIASVLIGCWKVFQAFKHGTR